MRVTLAVDSLNIKAQSTRCQEAFEVAVSSVVHIESLLTVGLEALTSATASARPHYERPQLIF
jgi:hypothetical protein